MALFNTFALCLFLFSQAILSKTVSYNWDITWVTANPDGRLTRPVIGINGQWPCPTIKVDIGDHLVVNVNNKLGNESTTLHWHGILQQGSGGMDGPAGVTQCPIPPGQSFQYDFHINQPGNYWYHSHVGGQYVDGLRGPIIVNDPRSPYQGQYDAELVLTFSDWYHDQMPTLIPQYLDPGQNPSGGEPVPYSPLLNEGKGDLSVQPGKTYLLRIISMAAFAQAYLWIDQHELTIIDADGTYVEPKQVQYLYIATAQRYSVLLKTKANAVSNYAITASMDVNDFDHTPSYLDQNVTATLKYGFNNATTPEAPPVSTFTVIDEFHDLTPVSHAPALLGKPDQSIVLNLSFFPQDGQNRAGFNGVTNLAQKVAPFFTALTTGPAALNPVVYGANTNAFVAHLGDLVEIVVNNLDTGPHIMHLHGHTPQLIKRVNDNIWGDGGSQIAWNGDTSTVTHTPMSRDTWILPKWGYTVVRFRATNPGVWIVHCHMEWHVLAGLTATIIEAPLALQASQRVNPAMTQICQANGMGTYGNAVGRNGRDVYNLQGQVVDAAPGTERGALFPH